MSVTLSGTGGVIQRFGRLAYIANQIDAFRGSQHDAMVSAVYNQYASNEQLAVTNLYQNVASHRTAYGQWLQAVQQVMQDTLVQQVNRDDPLPSQTTAAAWAQLITQMTTNSDSIKRPTIAATVTAGGSNVGDAVMVASATDRDGTPLDYALAETVVATVVLDGASGATSYKEVVNVVGDPARDPLAYNWPGGSGCNASANIVDGESATLVTDGAFETWTTSTTPTYWTIVVGAATVARGASAFRGSYNMQITSDGSTLTRIRSAALTLSPLTVYAVNAWAKISAAAVGTVVMKLVDVNGTTINDAAGAANSVSIDTNALTTSYASKSGFFRTPRNVPATVYLDIAITVAPTSGRVISIDTLALVAASQFAAGCPWFALFSGATRSALQDKWTTVVTNSLGNSSLARSLDRFFGLRQNQLKVPSSATETLPDILIGQY